MSWIERIQQQPESVRTRYLFSAVGLSFCFVLVIWFFSLKTSLLGISSIGGDSDIQSHIRDFQGNVGSPPSLEGLLESGETLQGDTVSGSSGEGVLAPTRSSENVDGSGERNMPSSLTNTPPAKSEAGPSEAPKDIDHAMETTE